MVERSHTLAADIRSAYQMRIECEPGAREFAFVTLTQPKLHVRHEDCAGAIARFFASWTALVNAGSRKRNATLRMMIRGGLRSVEVVWSQRRKRIFTRDGRPTERRVRYSGWHVHAHCIFELESGVRVEDFAKVLRAAWRELSEGSEPEKCVDVQPLDLRRVGQLAKYLTKVFELPDSRARELFRAAHGRQILCGFGDWRGWRGWVERPPTEFAGCMWGSESMDRLSERVLKYHEANRGALVDPAVVFQAFEWISEDGEKKRIRLSESLGLETALKRLRQSSFAINERATERAVSRAERRASRRTAKRKDPR